MDYITIQYLNCLQYGPYCTISVIFSPQHNFFNNENGISYNKYPISNNIYAKQNTRQENTKQRGWEGGGNILRTIHAMGQHTTEACPIS